MKITFLGSGSAFVLRNENYHSNILIETPEHTMLFDAGTTIPDALNDLGETVNSFDSIFISHNHADHVGGLEYIAFKTYFSSFPFGKNKPRIIGHHNVIDELWDNSLKGGMRTLQGKTATLDTYFDVHELSMNGEFPIGDDVMCFPMITTHVVSDKESMPSYGLLIDNASTDITVFITGDTQFNEEMALKHYPSFDTIFHDCEVAEYPNSVHAQYHELVKLPEGIKEKMWLYHYTTNNGKTELPDAVADGFKGFVKRGDTFEY